MLDFTSRRAIKIIKEGIKRLNLDLTGKIILTEVGSKFYNYTPLIPALAGASKVYAITKDSSYGLGEEIKSSCIDMAESLGINEKIEIVINTIPAHFYKEADIITNSGNLRPLNEKNLSGVKKSAVVPLMYEKWELRTEDVDVEYCLKNGIKVAGTWEEHPEINVFANSAQLAIKLANEAGYEVFDNNIIVWSDDHFGDVISQGFKRSGARSVIVTNDYNELKKNLKECDFIFVCDYDESRPYFGGTNPIMDSDEILAINNALGIIHLYGDIDNELLIEKGFNVYPNKRGKKMYMTQTLGYVGLLPILNLQVAGFKVAEHMMKNEINPLVQYF